MKKTLVIFFFLALSLSAAASHIVGGEFELTHLTGNSYRLRMILYFDELNGSPGARDEDANIRFFRKRDNTPVFLTPGVANTDWVTLVLESDTDVEYTQLECSSGEIVTNRMVYTTTVTLRDDVFTDPQGYYIAWERCCRNYTITNIYSENVQEGGVRFAGQTFYLEFPPVVKDGQPFINNSPRLFPPLNDFACPFTPYYVDFAGVDDDGDSLVYSLVTPLNTFTSDAWPAPDPPGIARPGPYPEVRWRPGFGLDNIINGLTNLEISSDGFLTVTPRDQGLYVFAVRCEEYRDGVKIGEVRRDFQMLVVQTGGCPDPTEKPSIVGKGPLDADFIPNGKLTVSFDNTVPVEDRCFEVKITDPSSLNPQDGNQENVKIKAIPLDFRGNISEVLPEIKTAVITNGEGAFFQICFPDVCPYKPDGTFKIGIVAMDNACALPLTDTLYVTVTIEPPENEKPMFSNVGGLTEITETLSEGTVARSWPIEVADADDDEISYRLVPVDFILEDVGMTFTSPQAGQQHGPINKELTWDPKCDIYDFTQKTDFTLYFIVEDIDLCNTVHADTTIFNLSITDFSQIIPPVINYQVTPLLMDHVVTATSDTLELNWKIYDEPILINVSGSDADNTNILLRSNGESFGSLGASFPRDFDQGSVASFFNWNLNCNVNLDVQDEFEFQLMVVDSLNKCRFYKADTLHLIIHVEPPDNNLPQLDILSQNADQSITYTSDTEGSITAILGSPVSIKLTGNDADITPADVLKLELIPPSDQTGFEFTSKEGTGPLETFFTWTPDCSIFNDDDDYEVNYVFNFRLKDDRCFNAQADSVLVNITVRDVNGTDDEFLPPNVFTPNGDGKNDFFAMVKETPEGELENILPDDNCAGEFIRITIYNRWGKQVYENESRNFRWTGGDMPVGVFYYYILYTNKSYKGVVSIRY